jgi:hypothetical protein
MRASSSSVIEPCKTKASPPPSPLFIECGAAASRIQLTRVQKYSQLLLTSETLLLLAGVVVRARARLPVPQRGFAHLADASAAAPVLLGTLGVAVPRLEARRALPGGSFSAAVHAAAQLLHALQRFGVALSGGALDVLAGEEHVHVAESTLAKHLAELPLRLLEPLMRRRAEPPRRLEDVILVSRGFMSRAFDEAYGVLSFGRARACDYVAQPRNTRLVLIS